MFSDIRIEHFLDIIFDTLKLAGSKLNRLRVCLFHSILSPMRIQDLVGNVSDDKIH